MHRPSSPSSSSSSIFGRFSLPANSAADSGPASPTQADEFRSHAQRLEAEGGWPLRNPFIAFTASASNPAVASTPARVSIAWARNCVEEYLCRSTHKDSVRNSLIDAHLNEHFQRFAALDHACIAATQSSAATSPQTLSYCWNTNARERPTTLVPTEAYQRLGDKLCGPLDVLDMQQLARACSCSVSELQSLFPFWNSTGLGVQLAVPSALASSTAEVRLFSTGAPFLYVTLTSTDARAQQIAQQVVDIHVHQMLADMFSATQTYTLLTAAGSKAPPFATMHPRSSQPGGVGDLQNAANVAARALGQSGVATSAVSEWVVAPETVIIGTTPHAFYQEAIALCASRGVDGEFAGLLLSAQAALESSGPVPVKPTYLPDTLNLAHGIIKTLQVIVLAHTQNPGNLTPHRIRLDSNLSAEDIANLSAMGFVTAEQVAALGLSRSESETQMWQTCAIVDRILVNLAADPAAFETLTTLALHKATTELAAMEQYELSHAPLSDALKNRYRCSFAQINAEQLKELLGRTELVVSESVTSETIGNIAEKCPMRLVTYGVGGNLGAKPEEYSKLVCNSVDGAALADANVQAVVPAGAGDKAATILNRGVDLDSPGALRELKGVAPRLANSLVELGPWRGLGTDLYNLSAGELMLRLYEELGIVGDERDCATFSLAARYGNGKSKNATLVAPSWLEIRAYFEEMQWDKVAAYAEKMAEYCRVKKYDRMAQQFTALAALGMMPVDIIAVQSGTAVHNQDPLLLMTARNTSVTYQDADGEEQTTLLQGGFVAKALEPLLIRSFAEVGATSAVHLARTAGTSDSDLRENNVVVDIAAAVAQNVAACALEDAAKTGGALCVSEARHMPIVDCTAFISAGDTIDTAALLSQVSAYDTGKAPVRLVPELSTRQIAQVRGALIAQGLSPTSVAYTLSTQVLSRRDEFAMVLKGAGVSEGGKLIPQAKLSKMSMPGSPISLRAVVDAKVYTLTADEEEFSLSPATHMTFYTQDGQWLTVAKSDCTKISNTIVWMGRSSQVQHPAPAQQLVTGERAISAGMVHNISEVYRHLSAESERHDAEKSIRQHFSKVLFYNETAVQMIMGAL